MATKTPGIYFQEIDNTQYTNPRAVTGTTVCVVGFAKKGPIGVPVNITSYNSFLTVFGNGVDGYYSGLAVKNILSAGGGVIFVRVADATARPSNVIIKNGQLKKNGITYLDRTTDIINGTLGYENKKIYAVTLNNTQLTVRSPYVGKLTQASIFEQLKKEMAGRKATTELLHRGVVKAGMYSFEVSLDGEVKNSEGQPIEKSAQGFYVELGNDETTESMVNKFQIALDKGPNALFEAVLTQVSGEEPTRFDPSEVLNLTAGNYGFSVNDEDVIIEDITQSTTLNSLAEMIDKKISEKGVRCIVYDDTLSAPKIVFIRSFNSNVSNVVIAAIKQKASGIKELFYKDSKSNNAENVTGFSESTEEESNIFISDMSSRELTSSPRTTVKVENEINTDSILFTSNGDDKTVKIEKAPYGKEVTGKEANILGDKGKVVSINSHVAVENVEIGRDIADTRKTYFESTLDDNTAAPDLKYEEVEGIGNLLLIEKDPLNSKSEGFTKIEGIKPVKDSEMDMIAITTIENGSGTNNIAVEFRTIVSPIDENIVQHDVSIIVDGKRVETYENVSYVYKDDEEEKKNFVTVINSPVDNGGSKYINIEVKKNETGNPNINIKDGIYLVGRPNGDRNNKKTDATDIRDWNSYDYSIGTDGVTDDSRIFLEAMDKENAPIADEQLYNFHILIHPDNISQEVQDAAIALCEERKDSMVIIDPPVGLSKKAVIDWHNGKGHGRSQAIDSNYAATYWPWCKVYDGTTKQQKWVGPSVVMAAKYINVDRSAGSWYAPAGEKNGMISVMDIEKYPNKKDRSDLYLEFNRVNPIIKTQNGEYIVFGEKTLQRNNSALTKVHVRRMLIEIKKQIRGTLRQYIFMPNTSENLPKINANVTAILEKFKIGGGLDSYRVVCDDTNNTSETRQQDIINIAVGLVPNGTVEQINVVFNINKTDETVSAI